MPHSLSSKLCFLTAVLAVASLTAAPSTTLVISQVYGGGGNSGAVYRNDFIEVLNKGNAPVSLGGYSVQYASSTGTSWQVTNLSGTLLPGQYYLVQESQGAGGTTSLPAPDATGTLALSATAGKVALVSSQTALTSCTAGSVVDLVGFGSGVSCSETSPTAAPSNTTAVIRAAGGCTDTDNNSADFSVAAPTPRNSSSLLESCSNAPALTITTTSLPDATVNVNYSAQVSASGGSGAKVWSAAGLPTALVIDSSSGIIAGTPTSSAGSTFSVTVTVADASGTAFKTLSLLVAAAPSCSTAIPIGQIQGSGDASPLAGQTVTTTGIVTALRSNGYFLQSPAPGDGNPATSDGLFVFTSSAPTGTSVRQNLVCVTGTVAEFQGQTELTSPTTTALASSQPLPAAVTLTTADLNPAGPIDQLEKYAGMRVSIPSLTVTGPTGGTVDETNASATSNGDFYGVISGVPRPFREPGIALTDIVPAGTPANVPHWDTNPEVLEIYSLGQTGATPIDATANATVANLTGVLSYFPSSYELLPDPGSATVSGNISYTPVPDKTDSEITVASTNLERFYNTAQDPLGPGTVVPLTPQAFANRLNKASFGIRNVLKTPDLIAVEEMQDLATLQTLAAKINADAIAAGQTNPNYTAYLAEGNDISNINVGFLAKSTVTVVDVTQYGKDTTFVSPTSGSALLLNDRPPLVLRARASRTGSNESMPFTVIVNHLRSLTSLDDPATGAQVRAKRQKQAEFLADLIQSRQAADPTEKIIAIGDFNAYQFNDGYVDVVGTIEGTPAAADQVLLSSNALVNPALTALVNLAPAADRYSYVFSGDAQEIDQTLLNSQALSVYSRYAVARLNADFPEIYRNDPTRPERISDHDWPIVYLTLPEDTAPSNTDITSSVAINTSGLAYSRISKQYTATVTITNATGASINAPIQLVLANLSSNAALANATGTSAAGPFITTLPSGSLVPAATLSVTLRIAAPQTASPSFTTKVFKGTF